MSTPSRTSFGRDGVRLELVSLLEAPGGVAISGPPGIGKSRIAAEVAAEWSGEVRWIDLEGVSTATELLTRLGDALGVTGPTEGAVAHALRSRPGALLVLDHPERIAERVEEALARWLRDVPCLRCLIASRVRIGGARPWTLAPLDLEAAVALYLDRASTVPGSAEFPLDDVRALAEALDRLPLAIELAAARARLYPPHVLAARLPAELADRRRPDRHGSLRAALAASWELLPPEHQAALSAATALRGPFDAAAFEEVTGAGDDALEALLDASLVALARPGRFRMLETVRAFAAAHLDPVVGARVAERHAAHALALGRACADEAARSGDWEPVRELRADLEHVLAQGGAEAAGAALILGELALARGPRVDPTASLAVVPEPLQIRLACLRSRFLFDAGRGEEALTELQATPPPTSATEALLLAHHQMMHHRALNQPEAAERARARADGLAGEADPGDAANFRLAEAVLLSRRGEVERAAEVLTAARRLTRDAPAAEARRLAYLGGLLAQHQASAGQGIAHLEHALVMFRQQADAGWQGVTLLWLGGALFDQGHLDPAAESLARAAESSARAGDTWFESSALEHLAAVRLEQQRWDEVAALHDRILALPTRPTVLSLVQAHQGLAAQFAGRTEEAVIRYEAALAGFDGRGQAALGLVYRVFLALAAPERAEAALAAAEAEAERLGKHYPLLVRAGREIAGGSAGGASGETLAALRAARRADARVLLALCERSAAVAFDGSWFVVAGGQRVAIDRRPVLRRALAALASAGPGALVARGALLRAVWPGERMVGASADARLHSTVRALRRLGLEVALRTGEVDGELAYGLVPGVVVRGACGT
jgi:tetratricopeptide (TPR) repeat protein